MENNFVRDVIKTVNEIWEKFPRLIKKIIIGVFIIGIVLTFLRNSFTNTNIPPKTTNSPQLQPLLEESLASRKDKKAEFFKILPKITMESGIFRNLGVEGENNKFSIELKYTIESEIPARAYNIKQVDCVIYDGLNKAGSFKIEDSQIFKYQRGDRSWTSKGGSKLRITEPKVQLVLYVDNEIIESSIFNLKVE